MSKSYQHDIPGIHEMERMCNNCIWYNSLQRVEKDGTYIINCESEKCKEGREPFNILINGLLGVKYV